MKKEEEKEGNQGEAWRSGLVEQGMVMLEPLIGKCLKFVEGWWTYEYCHRQYVRQYHETSTPKEKGFDVLLGREEGDDRTSMHDEPDHPVPDTSLILGTDAFRGSRQMLLRRYTGGSECELTGRPRTVEVEVSSFFLSPPCPVARGEGEKEKGVYRDRKVLCGMLPHSNPIIIL